MPLSRATTQLPSYLIFPVQSLTMSSGIHPGKQRTDVISYRMGLIKHFLRDTNMPGIKNQAVQPPRQNLDIGKFLRQTKSKLRYVSSGSGGHTFRGRVRLRNGTPFYYAMKIVPFRASSHYGDETNAARPENAEINALCYLSQYVRTHNTPHIVCPITMFNTSIDAIQRLNLDKLDKKSKYVYSARKYDKFLEFLKQSKNQDRYLSSASVLISEWANGGDLLTFLKDNYKTLSLNQWRVIIFQVLHPLAVVHKMEPGFRHNDLKANNILIHVGGSNRDRVVKYNLDGQYFYVPDINLDLWLWDFDFSCIPGKVENAKVKTKWCSKINITTEKNQYYDMHYFFYTLFFHGFLKNFFKCRTIPQEMVQFVKRVVPKKARADVLRKGRTSLKEEINTPLNVLLNDPFFKPFQKQNPRNQQSELSESLTSS